jgi:hypothetical protein
LGGWTTSKNVSASFIRRELYLTPRKIVSSSLPINNNKRNARLTSGFRLHQGFGGQASVRHYPYLRMGAIF